MANCLVNITHDTDPTFSPIPVTGGSCPLLKIVLEKKDIQLIREQGFTVEVLEDPYDEAAIQREKAAALRKALHGNVDRTPAPRQVKPVAPTMEELSPKRRPVRVAYRRPTQEVVAPVETVEQLIQEVQHVEVTLAVAEPVAEITITQTITADEVQANNEPEQEVIEPEGALQGETSTETQTQEESNEDKTEDEESDEMSSEELVKLRAEVNDLKTMAQAKKLLDRYGIDLGTQMPSSVKDLRKILIEMIDS